MDHQICGAEGTDPPLVPLWSMGLVEHARLCGVVGAVAREDRAWDS